MNINNLVSVEGNQYLKRDPKTNALLNCNYDKLNVNKMLNNLNTKYNQLETKIHTIDTNLNEMKSMLIKLLKQDNI